MAKYTVKQLFHAFLARQGITIQFKLALIGLYESTEEWLDFAEEAGVLDKNLIIKAFSWEDSMQLNEISWKYHSDSWQTYLIQQRRIYGDH